MHVLCHDKLERWPEIIRKVFDITSFHNSFVFDLFSWSKSLKKSLTLERREFSSGCFAVPLGTAEERGSACAQARNVPFDQILILLDLKQSADSSIHELIMTDLKVNTRFSWGILQTRANIADLSEKKNNNLWSKRSDSAPLMWCKRTEVCAQQVPRPQSRPRLTLRPRSTLGTPPAVWKRQSVCTTLKGAESPLFPLIMTDL